jgi:hypothetical protein
MKKGANFSLKDVPPEVEFEPLTLLAEDGAVSRGMLYRPRGKRPKVGVHLMHPRTDQTQNYNILPLVRAGYAVMGRAGRWALNDINTVHEKLLLDVAAGVRTLREVGCEAVVLLGNSGGGALSTYYQSQARKPLGERYDTTPAGDPFDLNRYELPAADGVVLIGTHPGEGYSLAKWLDPSVTDESDPLAVDASLDMYNFDNGFRIPPMPSRYSAEFLERWHAGRLRRLERMDGIARARVQMRRDAAAQAAALGDVDPKLAQAAERRAQFANHMPIWRTMADPAWLDPTIEPDDRDICSFGNDPRPDLVNFTNFLSPFLTPEAYLSTWSGISGRAKSMLRLKEFTDPVIVVHYAGDGLLRLSEARQMFDASASAVKDFEIIRHVDHYSFKIIGPHQRGERSMEGCDAVVSWMQKHFPIANIASRMEPA